LKFMLATSRHAAIPFIDRFAQPTYQRQTGAPSPLDPGRI
jgi:hypothetical protein